jgi:adenylate cyclase
MSLSMACVGCGFEIQADFAFCPRCGRQQAPGASRQPAASVAKERPDDADRRPVTVLFADLCGFTSLSERLDPEEVRSFQGVLFDSLGQAVTRRGGFVAKYLGDAVLALFGAPVAHEDAAWPSGQPAHRRAYRAGGRRQPGRWRRRRL